MTTRGPGAPRARPSVAIVGGGVAGLSLARALPRAGAAVELFDAAPALGTNRPPDAGASALPVALLNPWRGRKGAAHPDDLTGLAATWRWARELEAEGRDGGAHRSGVLRIATSERQAATWRGRVEAARRAAADERPTAHGPLAWLAPDAVGAPYHAPHGAVLVREGGWLEPRTWLQAVADSATARGATVRLATPIALAERQATGAWTLHDAGGARVATADVVVVCVGADAAPLLADRGARIAPPRLQRTRGEVVTLGSELDLPHPLAGGVYGASSGDGRIWAGGGHRAPEEDDPSAPANVREAFAWAVPALADASVRAAWSGVRAKAADARPRVEELAPGLWWFGAFAGRGFLCAAERAERFAARWAGAGSGGEREGR